MHVEGRDIWLPIVANLARRKVIVGLSWHIFVPRPQCQKPNRKCLGVFDQPLSDWTSYDLHLIWCWLVTGLSSKTSSSVQRGRRGLQNGRVVSRNCHGKLDCLALSWFLCFLKKIDFTICPTKLREISNKNILLEVIILTSCSIPLRFENVGFLDKCEAWLDEAARKWLTSTVNRWYVCKADTKMQGIASTAATLEL